MANLSKRSQLLQALRIAFEAVAANQPSGDPFPWTYGLVSSGPLVLGDYKKQHSVGIIPGEETKTDTYPYKNCRLPIVIEFQRVRQANEGAPGDLAEEALTVVQRVVNDLAQVQFNLPDIFIDFTETGNTIDLDSFADKAIAGVLYIEVQYRHSRYDVRN